MRSKWIWLGVGVLLASIVIFLLRFGQKPSEEGIPSMSSGPTTPLVDVSSSIAVIPAVSTSTASVTELAAVPLVTKSPQPKPAKKPKAAVPPPAAIPVAPKVELHKELIPKNIAIVRFYYEQPITGPASQMEFEINGSGFTSEFEQMISVKSGHSAISVKSLNLITPNQIHGTFSIGPDVPTGFIFPQVLIQGKVVFQAPDPYAVIRPGEVLNLVFTEMEEGGRSGWFRVYTNLTDEMWKQFSIQSSTPGVAITNTDPTLPYIVNGRLEIGWQVQEGTYDLIINLKGKRIWEKPGIIQVIKPNVGATGLIQKVITQDGFHRPGDKAKMVLQGSGFQPGDVNLLTAKVDGYDNFKGSFTFVAPGRMDLVVTIPLDVPVTFYNLGVFHGDTKLFTAAPAFSVVGLNWTRTLEVDPPLTPGGEGRLRLIGRALEKKFVEKIQIEVDEPALKIGSFTWDTNEQASAPISAGPTISPGDYWVKMTVDGKPVSPQFGSIIRIKRP